MILDSISSSGPEDGNILLGLAVFTCLNVTLFTLPALAAFGVFRKRLPEVASFLILGWSVFYLLTLFVWFIPTRFP